MDTKTLQANNVRETWRSALAILKEQVSEPSFRTWLQSTRLNEIRSRESGTATAVVAVPSNFAAEWLRHHFETAISQALKACIGHPAIVLFKVEAPPSHRAIRALDGIPQWSSGNQVEERQVPVAVGQTGVQPNMISIQSPAKSLKIYPGGSAQGTIRTTGDPDADEVRVPTPVLNPRYTFDRLLVGRGNQLGVSVARRVAEEPGAVYNPLFVYGLRGVGKTHLLQAIGNDAYSHIRSRVLCVSSTIFENRAAVSRLVSPDSLGHIDLLLIDDLHHIAGASGRAAQRSLAIMVEGMLTAGKGIVVTAATSLDSMLALQDNLYSRLAGGMLVALELPDAEMRLRMVSHLAQRADKPVSQDALKLLASSMKSMAELCSTWERLVARCNTTAIQEGANQQTAAITVQDVQTLLAATGSESTLRRSLKPEMIIDEVAAYFDLEMNEICSSSRERRVMLPRQIAMYLLREQTDHSYEWIAHRFARRDHTTAIHSCARVRELLETNLEVRQMVLELRQMIYGEHQRNTLLERAS